MFRKQKTKEIKDDFIHEPMRYWEDIYNSEKNSPLLVIGDRSTMKNEVALQICKFLDDDFTVEKNVIYDVNKNLFKPSNANDCYLIPSFTSMHQRNNLQYSSRNLTLERALVHSRHIRTKFCLGCSNAKAINHKVANKIHDVVLVQKTYEDYHVVEYIHYGLPISLNTVLRPPNFDDVANQEEFVRTMKRNITVHPTKLPRCDESIFRKFETQRKNVVNETLEKMGEKTNIDEAQKMKNILVRANNHCSTALRELQFAEDNKELLEENKEGIIDEINDALDELQSAKESVGGSQHE